VGLGHRLTHSIASAFDCQSAKSTDPQSFFRPENSTTRTRKRTNGVLFAESILATGLVEELDDVQVAF
jgi:hypothetical protein